MNIKMLETFQSTGDSAVLLHEEITVTILEKGELYRVTETLGTWLIDNRKAQEIPLATYGAKPQPELRHDDIIYNEMIGKVEVVQNDFEELPEADETEKISKSKRGRKAGSK